MLSGNRKYSGRKAGPKLPRCSEPSVDASGRGESSRTGRGTGPGSMLNKRRALSKDRWCNIWSSSCHRHPTQSSAQSVHWSIAEQKHTPLVPPNFKEKFQMTGGHRRTQIEAKTHLVWQRAISFKSSNMERKHQLFVNKIFSQKKTNYWTLLEMLVSIIYHLPKYESVNKKTTRKAVFHFLWEWKMTSLSHRGADGMSMKVV